MNFDEIFSKEHLDKHKSNQDVVNLVIDHLNKVVSGRYIIENFPKNLQQAKLLERQLT